MKHAATVLALLYLVTSDARAAGSEIDRLPPGLPDDTPTIADVISLRAIFGPAISPDGESIAYLVRSVDWEENRFDAEIWLARDGEVPFQLTRTSDASSSAPRWSPDGRWIGFLTTRAEKPPVFRIRPLDGEAEAITAVETGVSGFRWSPDGSNIAFTSTVAKPEEVETRKKRYGDYAVEDHEARNTELWWTGVDGDGDPQRLTDAEDFHVDQFAWSPDGSRIPFASPFDANVYYGNQNIGVVGVDGGAVSNLTLGFDEDASPRHWTEEGIWFLASDRTARHIHRVDPETGQVSRQDTGLPMVSGFDLSADGSVAAFVGQTTDTLAELYRLPTATLDRTTAPAPLTTASEQIEGWPLGTRELVRWPSRDGAEIEGVLYRPPDHDPTEKLPLLVVIHGGPTGTSRPTPVSAFVYPVVQWMSRGALVLMPNYRGSAGYGADFRALNVRNLGVGDAWDVETGIEALIDRGWVDPERVGAMGWSQGGYISSFLATTSELFAGISDWMTYYVNTDIHGFTRNYLEATPWDDPDVYAKTSPMTYIQGAKTPTLIQHANADRRVPVPNAYQLYQGLRDVGVEAELIIFPGLGHGIAKPKTRLAANWQNWRWFEKHIWGHEIDLPLPEPDEEDE